MVFHYLKMSKFFFLVHGCVHAHFKYSWDLQMKLASQDLVYRIKEANKKLIVGQGWAICLKSI